MYWSDSVLIMHSINTGSTKSRPVLCKGHGVYKHGRDRKLCFLQTVFPSRPGVYSVRPQKSSSPGRCPACEWGESQEQGNSHIAVWWLMDPIKEGQFSMRTEIHIYIPHGLVFINKCGSGTIQSLSTPWHLGAWWHLWQQLLPFFQKEGEGKRSVQAKPKSAQQTIRRKRAGERAFEKRWRRGREWGKGKEGGERDGSWR